MDSNVDVTVVLTCFVKPASSELSGQSYILTPIDHLAASIPFRKRILFYKNLESSVFSHSELIGVLKRSLAEALAAFYPFAGRLRRRESDGKVEACRFDEGAMFVEAEVEVRLSDLGPDFQNRDWFCDLAPEVTKFVCEGYAIGLTYSHQVSDGNSFWCFWKTWAQIASDTQWHSIRLPDFSRHLLEPAAGDYSIPPHITACYNLLDYSQKALLAASKRDRWPKTVIKTFAFSRHFLAQLKHVANDQQRELWVRDKLKGVPDSFTTYEVLCAHVWERMILARKVSGSNYTKFFVTTGIREKCNSLPPNYFGNALHFNPTKPVTAKQLGSGSLAFAANLLREAKVKYDAAIMQAVTNEFARQRDANNLFFFQHGPDDIPIASSHNFPAYEVDYGWGKPERVRAAMSYAPEHFLLLFRGPHPGSIDVPVQSETREPEATRARPDVFAHFTTLTS